MPDITLCHSIHCEARKSCFRYMAEPNPYRQSYFLDAPGNGISCPERIDINHTSKAIRDWRDVDLELTPKEEAA